MTDEIALWKGHIKNREEKGQTVVSWCEENNITKGAYSDWRRQVMQAEGLLSKGTATTTPSVEPLLFAEVKTTEPIQLATLQVNWQDVSMQFKLDSFTSQCVFIFCNQRRNSIKILRYDSNGFVLVSKTLLDGMKFQ